MMRRCPPPSCHLHLPLAGVEAFYALEVEDASKGVADYLKLRRKLPDATTGSRRHDSRTVRGRVARNHASPRNGRTNGRKA